MAKEHQELTAGFFANACALILCNLMMPEDVGDGEPEGPDERTETGERGADADFRHYPNRRPLATIAAGGTNEDT